MSSSLTIAMIGLYVFLTDFYKGNTPFVNDRTMFSDIKHAYYGGCTEVYRPIGENLLYYDVYSLYPFAALNVMPGTKCTYILSPSGDLDLDNLFGFFYCEVIAKDGYLGILPYRDKNGLVYPLGT